ncbi:unnamed protein product [Closterium sp. NIES-54]
MDELTEMLEYPLPPQGPAPSGVSQVDPPPLVEPLEVSSDTSGPTEVGDPAADNTTVAAEPGGVPAGGTRGPGVVGGGGAGFGGVGARGTSTVAPTPRTVRVLTREQRLLLLEREECEQFERAQQQQHLQEQSQPQAPRPLIHPITTTAPATATTTAATAAPADLTAMASLHVLAFDLEGRPVQFDTWLDDLQLYLLSDIKDGVSLFDHVSSAATTPPTTADGATRSQWLSRNAAARLAIRNHLPLAECTHFGQHSTAQSLYDAVVAPYSSPATAALGRLLLPYLFPDLSAFATIEDLVSHLRTSDARYRAAIPAEFLDKNQPPMFITLYFIVTCLPDSLRSVKDHFLSIDPTSLTVDLLKQHLLAAETSAVAVGAARGTPRPPFFEGCSPSPLAPSNASAAAADISVPEDVGVASASAKRRSSKGKGGKGGGGGGGGGGGDSGSRGGGNKGGGGGGGTTRGSGGSGGGGGGSGGSGGSGSSGTSGGGTGTRRGGSGGGQRQKQQRRSETPSPQQLREWFLRGASGGSCIYVIRTGDRAGQTCGRSHIQHRCFSRLDDAWRAEFGDDVELPRWADLLKTRIAIFDLDFDAILSAMYALSVSTKGDYYRCVPPNPGIAAAALGASASGTLPGIAPAAALNTFTLDSGASSCFFRDNTTLTPLPAPVPFRLADPSGGPNVARSSTVLPCPTVPSDSLSGLHLPSFSTNLVAASCSCHLLSHQTLLWHHRLGHPFVPRLCGMHSCLFVSGLPRSLPPLPPSPAPTCLPCVEGRQRAAPHSSSFPPTTDPLQTLHMDMWGPARVNARVRSLDRTVRLQLRERFGQDLRLLRLHSDRGVMEVARTSMIHAAAPHFLWPFAVRYVAHQLNLWPRVSLPKTLPTLRWTGEVGDASVFRVWGSCAFVRNTSADKLSARAIPYVFLGFVPDTPGWQFYHPTSRRVFPSQDVTFDEPVLQRFGFQFSSPQPTPLSTSHSLSAPPSDESVEPSGPYPELVGCLMYLMTYPLSLLARYVALGRHRKWTRRSPLSRAVSLERRWSRYHADGPFHLVLRSRAPPPPILPQPPESSLTVFHDPLSDYLRASRPVVSSVLSVLVTDPTAPLSFVSALVTTIAGFASSHHLDYTAYLVSGLARSPLSGGAPVFPLEVLEDRHFELGFLAAAVPHLCAMLLAPEDPWLRTG